MGRRRIPLMRTTFNLEKKDFDLYRISVLASQGFHIYLNGHKIHTYVWWKNMPHYRLIGLGENEIKHLKVGKKCSCCLYKYGIPEFNEKTSQRR
jgi:hypothetical protein